MGGRQEYDDKTNKLISDTNASRPSGNSGGSSTPSNPEPLKIDVPAVARNYIETWLNRFGSNVKGLFGSSPETLAKTIIIYELYASHPELARRSVDVIVQNAKTWVNDFKNADDQTKAMMLSTAVAKGGADLTAMILQARLGGEDLGSAANGADDWVNLASPQRTKHILFGDDTGGGHLWPGLPEKTPFPKGWSGDKIMHEVSDIATDPSLKWIHQTGNGGLFTKAGNPARFEVIGTRDGTTIRVVVEPAGEGIITAHPVIRK